MTNQIKNFIEEGEKELLEKFKYLDIEVAPNYPKLDIVSLCSEIIKDRKEFAISLIKMIVEMVESEKKEEYYSCPRPNCRDLMENCKHVQEWMIHNQALDTISSKLKELYK